MTHSELLALQIESVRSSSESLLLLIGRLDGSSCDTIQSAVTVIIHKIADVLVSQHER
jgi:hypothetical protein